MKKYISIIIVSLIFITGLSYVYIQGQNVINSNDYIYIKGYNENQIYMKIYRVINDIKVVMDREVEKSEKILFTSKILNADTKGNIDQKFKIDDKGLYNVEFIKNNKIISTDSFLISDTNFISSYDGEYLYLDIRDLNNNNIKSDIYIVDSNGKTTIFNDKKELNYKINNLYQIYIKNKEGIAFKNYYYYRNNYPSTPIEFLKDKPIYKNNQEIKFNIYSFKKLDNYYVLNPNQNMRYLIKDPAGNQLVEKEIKTNDLGIYNDSYYLSENAPFGYYSVTISSDNYTKNTGFVVENYEKPTYEIDIKSNSDIYYNNNTSEFNIQLNYFDGNPVSEAEIQFYVYFGKYPMSRDKLVYDGKAFTNEKGNLSIPVKVDISEDGYYNLELISVDPSQKQMEKKYYVKVLKGSYNIDIANIDNSYLNQAKKYQILLTDRNGNKISDQINMKIYKEIYEDNKYSNKKISDKNIKVINGISEFSIEKLEQGFYNIVFQYKDSSKTYYLSVNDNNETIDFDFSIKQENNNGIIVEVNKPNNFNGYIYLSGLNVYEKLKLENNVNEYKINIPEKILENNIFLEIIGIYKGNVLKKSKTIDIKKNKLNYDFQVTTDKDIYKPGENVKVKIKTQEDENSIFNLSIVDDALYNVYEDNYNMLSSLYPKLYSSNLLLSGKDNYFYLRTLTKLNDEEVHKFASYKGSGTNENVREYFPENALWIPYIKVNGEKEINFTNPDSLTRWRINVLGINGEKIGTKKIKYESKKDFYITPYFPDFFIINDKIQLNVRIFNNTDKTKNINYKIYTENQNIKLINSSGEISLDQNESKNIKFTIEAKNIGKDKIIFDFKEDIVKLDYEVISDEIEKDFIRIINTDESTLNILKGESYRKFSVENIIKDNIYYLDNYKYRCSEQTVSTIIPLLIAKEYGYKIDNIDKKVIEALQILYKYQQNDGGWGWWMNSEKSNLLISSYVLEALNIIKNKGYQVSQKVIDDGLNYIKSNKINGYENYILNLYNEAINLNVQNTNKIDLLFMSLYDKKAFELIKNFISETEDIISFDANNNYTTDIELNSYLLISMIKNHYDNNSIIKLMNNIINLRYSKHWFSTKDTAIALRAILMAKDYLKLDSSIDDFIKSEENTNIFKKGIYEVLSNKKIMNDTKNVSIKKEFYKKYTSVIKKGDKNYLIDYFLNIDEDMQVKNINYISEDKVLEKDNFKYIYLKDKDYTIDQNIKYDSNKNQLSIYNKIIENPKEVMIYKELIFVIDNKNNLIKYENGLLYKNEDQILSMSIYNDNFIYISRDNDVEYLNINSKKYNISNDIFSVDTLDGEIYLFGEKTYIFDLARDKIIEKYPFVSKKIIKDKNKELEFFGGIKFYGNNDWSDIQGVYKINLENKPIELITGDILKAKIIINSKVKDFLTLESYILSNSQLLKNYNERKVSDSGKYYNYWYTEWNYSYTAYEFRKNKITFFDDFYSNGNFEYYFKILSPGQYVLKPDFAYNMYLPNSYGLNEKKELSVK